MVADLSKDARTVLAAARVILVPQFENLPPTVISVSLPTFAQQDATTAHFSQYCASLKSTIAAAEELGLVQTELAINACREGQRKVLDSTLNRSSSGEIFAGTVYLQKLDGVLKSLRHELCHRFLAKVAAEYLQKKIGEMFPVTAVFATLPLSPFNPLSIVRDMIGKIAVPTEKSGALTTEGEIAALCQSIFAIIENHLRTESTTEHLLDTALDRCVLTMMSLAKRLQDNQDRENKLRDELQALKARYPLFKRLVVLAGEYNGAKQAISQQREGLAEELKSLESASLWVETFLRGLVERVLCPYLVRTRIVQTVCAEHAELDEKLNNLGNNANSPMARDPQHQEGLAITATTSGTCSLLPAVD